MLNPKKDRRVRFCIEYRSPNTIAVRDSYLNGRTDELFDPVGDALIFSMLDANSVYCHGEIYDKYCNRTAFTLRHWLLIFLRTPYGLCNGPCTLQGTMDMIFPPIKWQFALMNLYRIIIVARSTDEPRSNVRAVLSLLYEDGTKLKLKRCNIFSENCHSFGHVIWSRNSTLADHTTDAIQDLKAQHNVVELKSFLGLCFVYWRFVLHLPVRKDAPPN